MNIKRYSKKHKTVMYQNNSKNVLLNIKNIELNKDSHNNSFKRCLNKKHSTLKLTNFNTSILKNSKKRKSNKTNENKEENIIKQKLNNFMDNYLSTEINYKDYDDAIKLDKRKFFEYLWEKVKSAHFILDIILVKETLKTRPIKILLLLIKINLHFLINALFMNEDYISEVYHSKDDKGFFSFIKRMKNNLFYISTIGAFSSYLINCFFFDEKKIKHIFKREKNNEYLIKKEIYNIIRNIQRGYLNFFITSYVITIFSWYFISCFNNVYYNTSREWIISSIFIFFALQTLYILFCLIETILRFLSFKLESEKLFKVSKVFD